jgi:hypothetical protein
MLKSFEHGVLIPLCERQALLVRPKATRNNSGVEGAWSFWTSANWSANYSSGSEAEAGGLESW